MPEQTKRIEALDIAKGIGIILVIIGHMVSSYPFMWIYSFHMPLFFIISGICFKEEKYPSFLRFIKKRIQTIAIPAVALYFIILTLQTIVGVNGLNLQEQWEGVHPGSLWFLVTLFLIELLYFPLCRIPIRWRIPLLLASACLGVFLSRNQITFFFRPYQCVFLYGLIWIWKSNISVSPLYTKVHQTAKKSDCRIFINMHAFNTSSPYCFVWRKL